MDSYADLARQWWDDPTSHHGPNCPDLPCADLRATLNAGAAVSVSTTHQPHFTRAADRAEQHLVLDAKAAAPAPTTFGDLLRKYRMDRRFRQSDLAIRLGVSESYISKLETGATSPPSRFMVASIAEALDLHLGRRINLLDAAGHPARARRAG